MVTVQSTFTLVYVSCQKKKCLGLENSTTEGMDKTNERILLSTNQWHKGLFSRATHFLEVWSSIIQKSPKDHLKDSKKIDKKTSTKTTSTACKRGPWMSLWRKKSSWWKHHYLLHWKLWLHRKKVSHTWKGLPISSKSKRCWFFYFLGPCQNPANS